jgi:hypothetical protein
MEEHLNKQRGRKKREAAGNVAFSLPGRLAEIRQSSWLSSAQVIATDGEESLEIKLSSWKFPY